MKTWKHPHVKELDVMNTNHSQSYNCCCPPSYSEVKKDRDKKDKHEHGKNRRRHK
ncbi:MAG: hypothetical protein ACYDEX_08070 [Mobilitalea sp.]